MQTNKHTSIHTNTFFLKEIKRRKRIIKKSKNKIYSFQKVLHNDGICAVPIAMCFGITTSLFCCSDMYNTHSRMHIYRTHAHTYTNYIHIHTHTHTHTYHYTYMHTHAHITHRYIHTCHIHKIYTTHAIQYNTCIYKHGIQYNTCIYKHGIQYTTYVHSHAIQYIHVNIHTHNPYIKYIQHMQYNTIYTYTHILNIHVFSM